MPMPSRSLTTDEKVEYLLTLLCEVQRDLVDTLAKFSNLIVFVKLLNPDQGVTNASISNES